MAGPPVELPLVGRTVVVTRAERDAGELTARLMALGAKVFVVPCITVQALPLSAAMRAMGQRLAATAWVAFASRHGVTYFAELLAALGLGLPTTVRLAAVGPATAAQAAKIFRPVDLIGAGGDGAALGHALAAVARPEDGPIVLPAAAAGRPELGDVLRQAGFRVTSVAVYETRSAQPTDEPVVLPGQVDSVLFTSPSTVEGFLARAAVPDGAQVITLGPTTSAAVRAHGLTVRREATPHSLDGLLAAVIATAERK